MGLIEDMFGVEVSPENSPELKKIVEQLEKLEGDKDKLTVEAQGKKSAIYRLQHDPSKAEEVKKLQKEHETIVKKHDAIEKKIADLNKKLEELQGVLTVKAIISKAMEIVEKFHGPIKESVDENKDKVFTIISELAGLFADGYEATWEARKRLIDINAKELKAEYDKLVKAGFTPDQAFQLILAKKDFWTVIAQKLGQNVVSERVGKK